MNRMEKNNLEQDYLINVKKNVAGKDKTSIVDVRDVNWEQISEVWKNDAGWEPMAITDAKKLEKWIKKSKTPIKETPLIQNAEKENSWREVVQVQKRSEEKFRETQKNKLTKDVDLEKNKKGNGKTLLIYATASVITALGLALVYVNLIPNIEDTKKFIDSFSESPIKKDTPEQTKKVMDSNKAYFMKYIIEESIWKAKVKASLFNKAQGRTYFHEIKNYANINATVIDVINIVNKMFEKFDAKSTLTIEDLNLEVSLFEQALSSEEKKGKEILCYLTRSRDVSLGTYPSKKVAEKANQEKWISPLGSLHEARTGKPHKGKYSTDPGDSRSVGVPVTWVSNSENTINP